MLNRFFLIMQDSVSDHKLYCHDLKTDIVGFLIFTFSYETYFLLPVEKTLNQNSNIFRYQLRSKSRL